MSFEKVASQYLRSVFEAFNSKTYKAIEQLANDLLECWISGSAVYICGNGGSAANAVHIANDLIYGIGACSSTSRVPGLDVEAITSNTGILSCLGNDTGYENVFSLQLDVKGKPGDILLVLSGSGNSANVVKALEKAKVIGMKSYAILGFTGGKCLELADIPIHFKINDMQVAEDTQLIVGHICMQWLSNQKEIVYQGDNSRSRDEVDGLEMQYRPKK